jgi:hypothetical protein
LPSHPQAFSTFQRLTDASLDIDKGTHPGGFLRSLKKFTKPDQRDATPADLAKGSLGDHPHLPLPLDKASKWMPMFMGS